MKKAVIALIGLGSIGASLALLNRQQRPADNAGALPVTSGQKPAPILQPTRERDPIMPNTGSRPRGIRNNNPLNIEFNAANNWQGQTGSDGRFAIFTKAFFGIRAGARLLKNYRDKHGLTTVRGIIARFAPAFENNVPAYINSVTKRSGLFPDLILAPSDYPKLIEAMIHHENGEQPYSMELIEGAVNAGFN